jgi:hypothetical protein
VPYANCPRDDGNWKTAAKQNAQAAGFSVSSYDFIIHIWARGSCADGVTYGGTEPVFSTPYLRFEGVRAHELGHAYLPHDNSQSCVNARGQPVMHSGTCWQTEYGNPFDVMGSDVYSGHARHYNATFKDLWGFLDSSEKQVVSQSGVYIIKPLERAGGPVVLQVPLAGTRPLVTSPDPSIGPDQFSARWTGRIRAPTTGSYQFQVVNDWQATVWLNGQQIISSQQTADWIHGGDLGASSGSVNLVAGKYYDLRVDYRENNFDGTVRLMWTTPTTSTPETIPASLLYKRASTEHGLAAKYFDNIDFTGTTVTRTDRTINFFWAGVLPSTGGQPYLYLEFRQPSTFDDFASDDPVVNGVTLYQGMSFGATPINDANTRLWDTTPETATMSDAPLGVGRSVFDPPDKICITTLSTSASGATVSIQFGAQHC